MRRGDHGGSSPPSFNLAPSPESAPLSTLRDMANSKEHEVARQLSEPPGGDDVDNVTISEAVILPPELLLEIIKHVYHVSIESYFGQYKVWVTTMLNIVKVSRSCHSLGMRVLLRDMDVCRYFRQNETEKLANFLEDGLGIDKFSAVRFLSIDDRYTKNWNLCAKLIRKVSQNLEELKISLDAVPPEDFWKDFEKLHRVKKLTIETNGVRGDPAVFGMSLFGVDARAFPYYGLLLLAENWKHLESFHLDTSEAHSIVTPSGKFATWPEELGRFPQLTKKATLCYSYLGIPESDVEEWAEFRPANVKSVFLFHIGFGSDNSWKSIDAFPDLRTLRLEYLNTSELLVWPLRKLKTLFIEYANFNLKESEYAIARKLVQEHDLNLTLFVNDSAIEDDEMEARWIAEANFWKTVKGVKVLDDYGEEWKGPRIDIG